MAIIKSQEAFRRFIKSQDAKICEFTSGKVHQGSGYIQENYRNSKYPFPVATCYKMNDGSVEYLDNIN